MFTAGHFIWLGIVAAVMICLSLLQKKLKLSFHTILTGLFCVCIASEAVKIFSNMVETGYKGGMALDPADLPFHLCSIQIFLVFALRCHVKEETREKLLAFMVPTMLMGGMVALFIPTVGVSFAKAQVYQYFLFHAAIVFFAIYVLKSRLVHWNWRVFLRNQAYVLAMALLATWVNSILSVSFPKVNFMYLCRPPMENLPLLNLDNDWYAYVITLGVLEVVLMAIFHGAAILISRRRAKALNAA